MDWSNLLSGVVGALIGVAGALGVSIVSARDGAAQARQAGTLQVSGQLATLLVAFYEELRLVLDAEQHRGHETLDIGHLGPPATALRRAITVDAPLLGRNLNQAMTEARSEIRRVVGRQPARASRADLTLLLDAVRRAGDLLRVTRDSAYEQYGRGAKLGSLRRRRIVRASDA